MKKIAALLLMGIITVSAVALSACGGIRDWNAIVKNGYIVVGYDNQFLPMGYIENGKDVGYDLDLAKAMGEILGIEVRLQHVIWDSKEAELQSGNIDLIWNGFTINEKRKKNILFSNPYMKNRQIIVVRLEDYNNGTYTTAASLTGKNLVCQRGSSAKDAVLETPALKDNNLEELKDNVMILTELGQKTYEAAVMDSVVAEAMVRKNPDFKILDETLANEEFGIGMRLNATDIKEKIDAALKTLYENGTMENLADKYLIARDLILGEKLTAAL